MEAPFALTVPFSVAVDEPIVVAAFVVAVGADPHRRQPMCR